MKYFCPLENIKTITGRDSFGSNGINAQSTNINGWEIAANGIWAGGKNTAVEGTYGNSALGIFSKNWSIGSDGNVYLNNFKLIKDNKLNEFILFGKNSKKLDQFQRIITIKEDDDDFELNFGNCKVKSLVFTNPLINENKYPSIGTNTNGYLNLNGLVIIPGSKYYFYNDHISRPKDVNYSYTYRLPEKSGEILVGDNDTRINQYYYDIEFKEYFPLVIQKTVENGITTYKEYKLTNDQTIKTNKLETINKDESHEINYSYNPYIEFGVYNETKPIPIKGIKIIENNGISNLDIIFNLDTSHYWNPEDYERPNDGTYITGIKIYRYSIGGKKDTFRWKTNGTWVKIS